MLSRSRRFIRHRILSLVFWLADLSGIWRYPFARDKAGGDKGLAARLYWYYKATRPIVRGERGAGIEEYFRQAIDDASLTLPGDFGVTADLEVSAVGDLMRADGLANSRDLMYSDVEDLIFGSDVSFANLESNRIEIPDSRQGLFVHVDENQFHSLIGHQDKRFTIVATANNHILDGGEIGIHDVHRQLSELGIDFVGTAITEQQVSEGVIVERNGIRIGFVAATYGVNKAETLQTDPFLVSVVPFARDKEDTDLGRIESQVTWCRQAGCEFIIASLHWGHEFEFFPRQYQVQLAHRLAEAGVDAILGHHSHTIQPFEIYQTQRDPQRKVPIFYGLGNLVSWSSAAYRCLSLVVRLRLAKGAAHGGSKVIVSDIAVTPVLQLPGIRDGRPVIRIRELSDLTARDDGLEQGAYIQEAASYAELIFDGRRVDGCSVRISADAPPRNARAS